MAEDDITITLEQADAALILYGLQAFVSLLTGQLEDAGAALTALSDDAGILALANAAATFITTVSNELHPRGER